MSVVERLMEENAGLRERAEQAERALAAHGLKQQMFEEQAAQLAQAEQRVRTLAGVLTELVALSPGCGYCDSFDVITNVLDKARAALTPPEGSA